MKARQIFVTFLILSFLSCIANCQGIDEVLVKNLGGNYSLIDLKGLFNIEPKNPSFLAEECPTSLSLTPAEGLGTFNLMFEADATSNRCRSEADSALKMAFDRAEVPEDKFSNSELTSDVVTLEQISFFYPILIAVSPNALVCRNKTTDFTQIAAQDSGYWHTLVNHYNASEDSLGATFSETSSAFLSKLQGVYALNVPIDVENGYGCSYLQAAEEERLRERILQMKNQSSQASPTANATSERRACFPGNVKVKLKNGELVQMRHLRVGDSVLDSVGSYSKVLLFSHTEPDVVSEFVVLSTLESNIAVSPSHYIYANNKLTQAASVHVGDVVEVIDRFSGIGRRSPVVGVESQFLGGLYNPQTESGKIAVFWDGDAILASTYTTAISPLTGQALLVPLRWLDLNLGVTLPGLSRAFRRGDRDLVALGTSLISAAPWLLAVGVTGRLQTSGQQ